MPGDDEIRAILLEPGTSQWMRDALSAALDRELVHAVNDVELHAIVLRQRAMQINTTLKEQLAAQQAMQRPAYDRE